MKLYLGGKLVYLVLLNWLLEVFYRFVDMLLCMIDFIFE